MSFRKRNVIVSSSGNPSLSSCDTKKELVQGVRPSPLDGRLTTSTGTQSLDALLAGHAGLALGTSLLIEESGTTDFGGILLRYFAAEGIVQGHQIHVFGMNEAWGRDLPGCTEAKEGASNIHDETNASIDRMKIAWRYERLGEFGRDRALVTPSAASSANATKHQTFCHDFDLTKRLVHPSPSLLKYVPQGPQTPLSLETRANSKSPFSDFIETLILELSKAPKSSIHRVVFPGLLSPAAYANNATVPEHLLQFLHSLRALLRKYSLQLTALITLPLMLYPRGTGLIRWAEILSDGVIELTPFPTHTSSPASMGSSLVTGQDEMPQGILKVHRLPVLHEKGGGGSESNSFSDDLAFTLSRRKGLLIKPFSLPPIDGDVDMQHAGAGTEGGAGGASRLDIEF